MTKTEKTHPIPRHTEVADRLSMSVSGVSRIRAGQRKPSNATVNAISQTYGWPRCVQLDLLYDEGAVGYAEELNRMLYADATGGRDNG